MKRSTFFFVSYGFIGGIFLGSFVSLPQFLSIALFFCATLSCLYLWKTGLIYSQPLTKTFSFSFLISLAFLSFSFAVIRYELFTRDYGDPNLENFAEKNISAEGVVVSEPDEREASVRYVVALEKIKNGNNETEIQKTKIIVSDDAYASVSYGDQVEVRGLLKVPEDFQTESGKIFRYRAYLEKDKIFYELKRADAKIISTGRGSFVKRILFAIKNSYIKNLDQNIPFPESRLGAGVTIAGKRALPKQIQDEYQRTGALQVVVLSGYNVTIVAETLMALLSKAPQAVSSSVGLFGIIIFAIAAGGTATVVRATIMASLVIFASILRRKYSVTRALFLSALFMILMNPMILVFDPSFQLSFISTLGLIYVSPIIKKYFFKRENVGAVLEIVVATTSTQIFVMPFILYLTGNLSIVSLPTNFLLSLIVPVTMFVSFLSGFLGWISAFVALPFSYAAFALLFVQLKIVHIFSSVPFASIQIFSFPIWAVAVAYTSYVVIIKKFKK